ncbi:hypothetical protein [Stenotrophomonas sp.]|uniref:hypothetical protein n=1 Tax=Stenotrophomonas sp. TaxID=69392 RepID=UPI0028AFA75A|nr:hypothetical protein [Stenotrophomonas sp.]
MAKPTYLVTVVRPGKEALFRDFIRRQPPPKPGDQMPMATEELAFIEPIRASNRREALVLARALHPGLEIAPRIARRAARPARK